MKTIINLDSWQSKNLGIFYVPLVYVQQENYYFLLNAILFNNMNFLGL